MREREELRPKLSVKMWSFTEMGNTREKSVFGDIGKKYQVFIFEHVIVYMALGDLNGDVKQVVLCRSLVLRRKIRTEGITLEVVNGK